MSTLSRLLGGALAAAAVTGTLGLTTGTAHAQVLPPDYIDTDQIKINAGNADFGSGLHLGGAPVGDGDLSWRQTESGIKARLVGTVYWDSAFSGGCALVRMRVYDRTNRELDRQESGAACRGGDVFGGGVVTKKVDLSFTSKDAHHVVVDTRQAPGPGGPWKTAGSERRNLGQPGGWGTD